MPYKDKAMKSLRQQERRLLKPLPKTGEAPGEMKPLNEAPYPAILHALTDPVKRRKLEKICESLKNHNVEKCVTYGVYGPDFEMVGELLEVTS